MMMMIKTQKYNNRIFENCKYFKIPMSREERKEGQKEYRNGCLPLTSIQFPQFITKKKLCLYKK